MVFGPYSPRSVTVRMALLVAILLIIFFAVINFAIKLAYRSKLQALVNDLRQRSEPVSTKEFSVSSSNLVSLMDNKVLAPLALIDHSYKISAQEEKDHLGKELGVFLDKVIKAMRDRQSLTLQEQMLIERYFNRDESEIDGILTALEASTRSPHMNYHEAGLFALWRRICNFAWALQMQGYLHLLRGQTDAAYAIWGRLIRVAELLRDDKLLTSQMVRHNIWINNLYFLQIMLDELPSNHLGWNEIDNQVPRHVTPSPAEWVRWERADFLDIGTKLSQHHLLPDFEWEEVTGIPSVRETVGGERWLLWNIWRLTAWSGNDICIGLEAYQQKIRQMTSAPYQTHPKLVMDDLPPSAIASNYFIQDLDAIDIRALQTITYHIFRTIGSDAGAWR